MIPMTLDQAADVVGGDLANPADGVNVIDSVTIDSRAAGPGALFIPLVGTAADGHRFIPDAVARGASGYLIAAHARPLPEPGALIVDDPADALLGMGIWMRDTVDPLVIALTGSQGKTTTKDLVAAAVRAQRPTVASPNSFNNEIGVPLTCCDLEADTEVLVSEIGARGIGHIAELATPLRPDIAIVTAVGQSHLELLGSIEQVAVAKAELVEALAPAGVAVLNADDPRVAAMAARTPASVVTYGVSEPAEWSASNVELDKNACASFTVTGPAGGADVTLGVPGLHNVSNALAALAAADAAGVPLDTSVPALATAEVSKWRLELSDHEGVTLLNDAYNANPASTRAALDTVNALALPSGGRKWAVVGMMAELGSISAAAHFDIGAYAAGRDLDVLVAVGDEAAPIADGAVARGMPNSDVHKVPDADAALALVRRGVRAPDLLLIKASRSVGLEDLAADFTAAGGEV